MVKKLEATRQLQRIAALPYNPIFEEEVKKIRHKYAIPEDPDEAKFWFRKHYRKYDKSVLAWFVSSDLFPFLAAKRGIGDKSKRGAGLFGSLTEVPLEIHILNLIQRFRLPWTMIPTALLYVLTLERVWLYPSQLKSEVMFAPEFPGDTLTVIVTRLTPYTTRKQWNEIWNDHVKRELDKIKQTNKQVLGTPSRKRTTLASLEEQIKRWAEWYQLSEVEGRGPVEALEKWEQDHLEQTGKIDLSTVTHAIKEFKEIITPVPVKT
ncbi:MAG: hypothetical protein ISS51_03520 [Dehalococcoidales bacterium]|nr:hypothetical protein [Dehalococcoidales bacterium]